MAELLDTYNYQTGEFIAAIDRDIVHRDALWHKTVHCWLYDKVGQVYFQMRQDEPNGNLYVTASGHLRAGESVEAGFTREIKEEIGLSLLASDATESQVREYVVDRERPDGSLYRDRAWSNVFFYQYDGPDADFQFDTTELAGLVKIDATAALQLIRGEVDSVNAVSIQPAKNGKNQTRPFVVKASDFLVCPGEDAETKYGYILETVARLTTD